MKPSRDEIDDAQTRLGASGPQSLLSWALDRFRGRIAIGSSFSIEDCAVIDLAHKIAPDIAVFALDTGRLPEETYQTAERVRDKYGIVVDWQFPDRQAVEALGRAKGLYSFMESLSNRHECCGIRKVEPLGRALSRVDAWVTGLRREQAVTRTQTAAVEFDEGHGGLAKINPIIGWSDSELWAYAQANNVPIHPLHRRGYPSIGCSPCTRAIRAGEHPRAGRWWWESPDSKECGLHPVADKG
jgi:phosphoadenosine phosphosulfate reductase